MDNVEARSLLDKVLTPLRDLDYTELRERFADKEPEVIDLRGGSGVDYYVETEGFWDDGRPGPIRVLAGISDGRGWRAFISLCDSFIKAADGSFVGE